LELTYREIATDDIPRVLEIRVSTRENKLTMEELANRWEVTPESMSKALQKDVKGWLCEDSRAAVGFSMGNKKTGEMLVVAVLPGHERRGIGKNLMTLIQDWLWSHGHSELWLLATPAPDIRAYGFYRTLGWRATGEIEDGHEVMKLYKNEG